MRAGGFGGVDDSSTFMHDKKSNSQASPAS